MDMATEEPDGANLLVRIWEGLALATGRGYSTDPVDEQGDGICGERIVAGQQCPHVITDAGYTQQARRMIEQVA